MVKKKGNHIEVQNLWIKCVEITMAVHGAEKEDYIKIKKGKRE